MLPDIALVTTTFERDIYRDALNRVTYICDALPGNTDPSKSYWRIQRMIYFAVTRTVKYYRWADGSNEFRFIANDRASYNYANIS